MIIIITILMIIIIIKYDAFIHIKTAFIVFAPSEAKRRRRAISRSLSTLRVGTRVCALIAQ